MGMPLSKYSMLRALGYNRDSAVLAETKSILNHYCLFGLVIHDPVQHADFDKKLSDVFERMDYLTGENFLFLCLLDQKKEWLNKNERAYFNIWKPEELLITGNSELDGGDSISSYTLSQSLGIEYDDLPVIVLTENFQFNKFQVIKTCENHLEHQMTEIGYFCSQHYNKSNITDSSEFHSLIDDINLCGGNSLNIVEDSIAKILSDFLAFMSHSEVKDRNLSKDQMGKVITQYLSERKYHQDPVRKDQINLSLLGSLAQMRVKKETANSGFFLAGAEAESQIILNTYNRVSESFDLLNQRLSSYSHRLARHRDHNEESLRLDYTPLVISLCKVFEIEINLSIVHWIRESLNIEMPEYFKKRKNDQNKYTISPSEQLVKNPRPIDFNKGSYNKWIAPGIGESELIAKTLQSNSDFSELLDFNLLFPSWGDIRRIRNKAAHDEIISKSDFEEVKKSFEFLFHKEFFSRMAEIKKELRLSS